MLLCLGSCPEAAPVAAYLREELEAGREATCDRWHLNACSFYYAVSRAYANGVTELEPLRETILRRIERLQTPDGSIGNPSETARWNVAPPMATVQPPTRGAHRHAPRNRMACGAVALPAIMQKMLATSARRKKSRHGP